MFAFWVRNPSIKSPNTNSTLDFGKFHQKYSEKNLIILFEPKCAKYIYFKYQKYKKAHQFYKIMLRIKNKILTLKVWKIYDQFWMLKMIKSNMKSNIPVMFVFKYV
ncbi:hypothetical protein BpHYR1_047647 [Brachionus plicatilis]|uniref:Uncharacterized protein n=1 Tax=Brachionus plicatilis TaxID=10195 RepID=A0A3M7RXN7_BRAPC|nr:hypothetical protein BpHYR1_047647 [Brachionus plicatilis]